MSALFGLCKVTIQRCWNIVAVAFPWKSKVSETLQVGVWLFVLQSFPFFKRMLLLLSVILIDFCGAFAITVIFSVRPLDLQFNFVYFEVPRWKSILGWSDESAYAVQYVSCDREKQGESFHNLCLIHLESNFSFEPCYRRQHPFWNINQYRFPVSEEIQEAHVSPPQSEFRSTGHCGIALSTQNSKSQSNTINYN